MSRYRRPRPSSSPVERRANAIGIRLVWARKHTGHLASVSGVSRATVAQALHGTRAEQLLITEGTWVGLERGVSRLQHNYRSKNGARDGRDIPVGSLPFKMRAACEKKRDATFSEALKRSRDTPA